jgi:hypothetical protein
LEEAGEGIEGIRLIWMHSPLRSYATKSHAGNRWMAFIEHYAVDTIAKFDRIDIKHATFHVVVCLIEFNISFSNGRIKHWLSVATYRVRVLAISHVGPDRASSRYENQRDAVSFCLL